jgi:hypothetical protein
MMRLLTCLLFCLAASGCGKKQAAPPLAASAAASSQSRDQAQPSDPAGDSVPNPQTLPAGAPEAQTAAASSQPATQTEPVPVAAGDYTAVLSSLTQGLRRYGVEKQRVPASLNEVIAAGYIQVMPQPPPGRKFALDAKRMEVVLVKQ